MLKAYEDMEYHPRAEQIVALLTAKTQNTKSDTYFRVLVAYFFGQMASSMRANVVTADRGKIPINTYAMALMTSGAGKGHSLNICEDEIVNQFKSEFLRSTFGAIAEDAIDNEAIRKANLNSTDYQDELDKLEKEFHSLGEMPYSFSEGTGPAFKQVRTKAQIATVGALNFICDEVGSNLTSISELLTVGLEAYDVGKVKQKLTKNTSESKRSEERDAPVPTNMLLFGTPAKVFNGGMEEREVMSLLETGYARRLLFGFGNKGTDVDMTAEELYDLLSQASKNNNAEPISNYFGNLADPINFDKTITVDRKVGIKLMQYKMDCEALAETFPEQNEIHKAEMNHRYFKVLKLMGAYAFIDGSIEVSEDHFYGAVKVVQDSGDAFNEILNRPKPYERLAKYLSTAEEATLADLDNDLIYFKGANAKKQEMLQLATAWGYKNNIVIKRYYNGGIEFFKGETLKETNLEQMIFSASDHEAFRYAPMEQPWSMMGRLTQAKGFHWCSHTFKDNHRHGDNVISGFNMVVIDVDGGVNMKNAVKLLDKYTAHYYTTKRHTNAEHRFRIVLPMKYHLNLSEKDFKEFMNNIFDWLPFDVDRETSQRSKKWLSNKGNSYDAEGELFDPTTFIPKTSKNVERQNQMKDLSNLNRVEAWFARTELLDGNRNNGLLKYAMMLLDSGMDPTDIEQRVFEFNAKLDDPLTEDEIGKTILKSLWSKVQK